MTISMIIHVNTSVLTTRLVIPSGNKTNPTSSDIDQVGVNKLIKISMPSFFFQTYLENSVSVRLFLISVHVSFLCRIRTINVSLFKNTNLKTNE